MIRVGGKVILGCGHMGPRMKKFKKIFDDACGEPLIAGTVNVLMDREVPFREDLRSAPLIGDEWGWGEKPVLFEKCRIDRIPAYRIKGGHSSIVAEIACSRRIGKHQGTWAEIEFFETAEFPST